MGECPVNVKTKSGHVLAGGALLALGLLMGCQETLFKRSTGDGPGQTVARVAGEEITMSQYNFELARLGASGESTDKNTQKAIIDALADRTLLSVEAKKRQLHKEPRVVQAMEAAKNQILVQAYLEDKLSSLSEPTRAEAVDYFDKHPELFGKRRMMDVRMVKIGSTEFDERSRKALDQSKSMDDILQGLQARGINYQVGATPQGMNGFPPDVIQRLQQMGKGDKLVVAGNDSVTVLYLYDVKPSPLTFSEAELQIRYALQTQKRQDAIKAELDRLRGENKTEYLLKSEASRAPQ